MAYVKCIYNMFSSFLKTNMTALESYS